MILGEVDSVPKSVFNIGQLRHDVVNMEDIVGSVTVGTGTLTDKRRTLLPPAYSSKPSRLIEWDEKEVGK